MLASMDRAQLTNADLREQVDVLRKRPHRNAGGFPASMVTMTSMISVASQTRTGPLWLTFTLP